MSTTGQTAVHQVARPTNKDRQAATEARKMKITASRVIRWAGLSAIVGGLFYVAVGFFHPLNIPESVTTTQWIVVHILASAMTYFGFLGITGIYARQIEESGRLGLAGYLLLSLWLVLVGGFTFAETFILPLLATAAPKFVAGFLGMFTGTVSEMGLGALPTLWLISGPLYILGGLLFGIATFRAGILPRGAGVLLAVGTALGPIAAFLPQELQTLVAVPVGLALVWLGYALWSERHAPAADSMPATTSSHLRATKAR